MLWSQVVGASISGTVKDDSGAGLPAAAVSVKNIETGAERKLVTDDNGRYSAPSIAIGKYQVSASKEGFSSQTEDGDRPGGGPDHRRSICRCRWAS